MSEPATEILRYGPLVSWLRAEGITEAETLKLIAAGVIKKRRLRPGARAVYFRSQVREAVLSGEKIAHEESRKGNL